jgi:serine/threonine protein phosphatase PrpC
MYPGLAMTRSLGDLAGRECGVIATPEVLEVYLNTYDKLLVIASDGIWEVLSNSEVMRIVAPYYDIRDSKSAAQSLIRQAVERWE